MRENFAEEGGRLVTRERETHKQGSILLMWERTICVRAQDSIYPLIRRLGGNDNPLCPPHTRVFNRHYRLFLDDGVQLAELSFFDSSLVDRI